MSKRVIILGSTGSIGTNALEVVRSMPEMLSVVGLSAHTQLEALVQQAHEFEPIAVAACGICEAEARAVLGSHRLPDGCRAFFGERAITALLEGTDADIVLNGIAGSSGLLPSVSAVEAGRTLALANKESIVMAGRLLLDRAGHTGARILPVDSEHAAVFSLNGLFVKGQVAEIVLTASGGAFRDSSAAELAQATVEQALQHPTWRMGTKITIDCATLANKGLEVIEAHYLFGVAPEQIKVLLHPQSYVHSLVRTIDGSLYAQLGTPDMRVPIQNALTYPECHPSATPALDLCGQLLSFQALDEKRFRMISLAYEALRLGEPAPIVYNAANEVAVAAFTRQEIGFLDIAALVEEVLARDWGGPPTSFAEVLGAHVRVCRETQRGPQRSAARGGGRYA